jgi:hypothetical protein
MTIKKALDSILEGNLDEMRQNFSASLTEKAVQKLEERKIEIAQNYFGQVTEEAEQIDEVLDTPEKRMKYGLTALGSYVKASLTGDKNTKRKRLAGNKNYKKKVADAAKKSEEDKFNNDMARKALIDMGNKTGSGFNYEKMFKE